MLYKITLSPQTYQLLERRALQEQRPVDQVAETLLQEQLQADDRPHKVDWKDQLRQALRLSAEELEDILSHKPSPAELQEEISRHIPPGMKFSDEIIAMREE